MAKKAIKNSRLLLYIILLAIVLSVMVSLRRCSFPQTVDYEQPTFGIPVYTEPEI